MTSSVSRGVNFTPKKCLKIEDGRRMSLVRPQEEHGECEGEDVVGVGAVEVVELELAERHNERLQDGLGRVLKVVPLLKTDRC